MEKREFKLYARKILDPVVSVLTSLGVPPLLVSLVGLLLSVYGAVVVARGQLALGGLFLLLSGLCDVLDGDLARRRGMASRFGAFLDSTLDRVAEFAFFGGFLYYLIHRPGGPGDFVFVVTITALTGSVMTSYARARAEGLGYDCTVGIMERPERIAALTLGLLLGYRAMIVILTALAGATMYTFLQRILHVRRVSTADDRPVESPTPEPPAEADATDDTPA
ncbi:MAG: CDP-alcohol phosphatidyltransferase family protein [Candidatus Latescibacterota bacterium]|jgi:CDP-diacylglycerol--glycerol-3-phosphate 3-phosphatidyltransferase